MTAWAPSPPATPTPTQAAWIILTSLKKIIGLLSYMWKYMPINKFLTVAKDFVHGKLSYVIDLWSNVYGIIAQSATFLVEKNCLLQ